MGKRKREEIGQNVSPISILRKEEVPEPDETLYHFGRAIDSSYWMRCWSSLKVQDAFCKSVKMKGKSSYTLMSVYNINGSKTCKTGGSWSRVKLKYNKCRNELIESGVEVDKYDTMKNKVRCLEKILDELVLYLKELTGQKTWGVEKMMKHIGVLDVYLKNITKYNVESIQKVRILLRGSELLKKCLLSIAKGESKNFEISPAEAEKKTGKRKRKPRLAKKKGKDNPQAKEDTNIKDRPRIKEKPKPGASTKGNGDEKSQAGEKGNGDEKIEAGVETREDEESEWDEMFGGETEQFKLDSGEHPVIVLEQFRNKNTNELAKGPIKRKGSNENYEIGSEYLNNCEKDHDVRLAKVLACHTCDSYAYFFADADRVPHFVQSSQKYKKYMMNLFSSKANPSVTVLSKQQHQNSGPIKVLPCDSVRKGLRAGIAQDGEFFFFPGTSAEFQEFLNPDKLKFPTDLVMDYFDELQTNEEDMTNRGFKELLEGGFGREGVMLSTCTTQEEGVEKVVARPAMTGGSVYFRGTKMMTTISDLADKVQRLTDKFVRDENGEMLMQDLERNEEFGSVFRKETGCKKCRFEAFTMIRQFLGTVDDFKNGELFDGTGRHLDGPNDQRRSFNWTAVLSHLVVRNGKVYRITLILYTRASVGNWLDRNCAARHLRNKLRDYLVEHNGKIHYKDLLLQDDLSQYKIEDESGRFVPDKKDLTESFCDRNPEHCWRNMSEKKISNLKWKSLKEKGEGNYGEQLEIFTVPEMLNRFGFVSSFCHQINKFNAKYKPTYRQRIELLYVALLSVSQLQFYFIMEQIINGNNFVYSKELNLVVSFQQVAKDNNIESPFGGSFPRVRPQPYKSEVHDERLPTILNALEEAVQQLEDGKFLDQQGKYVHNPFKNLPILFIKEFGSISFPSICVFTGIAVSEYAIATAKQAMLNDTTTHSYWPKLREYLLEKTKRENIEEVEVGSIFKGVSISEETVIATVENGCCAAFRGAKRQDMYFKGENLFNLLPSEEHIMFQEYGSLQWISVKFNKDTGEMERLS